MTSPLTTYLERPTTPADIRAALTPLLHAPVQTQYRRVEALLEVILDTVLGDDLDGEVDPAMYTELKHLSEVMLALGEAGGVTY